MSRTTSRGPASVELLCETFHVSRQAYYGARKAPIHFSNSLIEAWWRIL